MSYNPSHHILVEWEMTIQVGCSCACSTCCLNLHHVPAAILREGNSHQHYCNKAVHKWQKLQNSTTWRHTWRKSWTLAWLKSRLQLTASGRPSGPIVTFHRHPPIHLLEVHFTCQVWFLLTQRIDLGMEGIEGISPKSNGKSPKQGKKNISHLGTRICLFQKCLGKRIF